MPTSPVMNLILPTPSSTIGPTWASQLNTALLLIDSHDHTTGKGNKITPAAFTWNADLAAGNYKITGFGGAVFTSLGATSSTPGHLHAYNGEIYWVSSGGTAVQITSGTGLNVASSGTIGGDYGAPGVTAAASYSDSLKTFSWLQNAGIPAKQYMSDILLTYPAASENSVTLKAQQGTAAYDIKFPLAPAATNNEVMCFTTAGIGTHKALKGTTNQITVTINAADITFSLPATTVVTTIGATTGNITTVNATTGNITTVNATTVAATTVNATTGIGIVPVGSIIPTMPNLTGAYVCSATTAADANGFVLCNGQTINDATSPMNGVTIPNLNNDVFLMGKSTAGTTGGANTLNLQHHHHVTSNVSVATHSKLTATDIPQISTSYTPGGSISSHSHDVNPPSTSSNYVDINHSHRIGYYWNVAHGSDLTAICINANASPALTLDTRYPSGSAPLDLTHRHDTDITTFSSGSTQPVWTGTPATITVGTAVGSQTQLSHSVTNNAVATDDVLSNAQDIRPNFVSVVYIMRIK